MADIGLVVESKITCGAKGEFWQGHEEVSCVCYISSRLWAKADLYGQKRT